MKKIIVIVPHDSHQYTEAGFGEIPNPFADVYARDGDLDINVKLVAHPASPIGNTIQGLADALPLSENEQIVLLNWYNLGKPGDVLLMESPTLNRDIAFVLTDDSAARIVSRAKRSTSLMLTRQQLLHEKPKKKGKKHGKKKS